MNSLEWHASKGQNSDIREDETLSCTFLGLAFTVLTDGANIVDARFRILAVVVDDISSSFVKVPLSNFLAIDHNTGIIGDVSANWHS